MVFDLESVAIDGAAALAEPVSPPANYRDEAKIAAYIAEKQAEQLARAALYPWTARIVALGTINNDGVEDVDICRTEDEERTILGHFWLKASFGGGVEHLRRLIGFGILHFDLPVLMARSRLLGVAYPKIDLTPWKCPHVDLLRELTFGQSDIQKRSLKWFAQRFGIPCDDAISGADIGQLVSEGKWDDVRAHCLSDIRLTKAIAEYLGVLPRKVAA